MKLVLCDDHRLFGESLATAFRDRGWQVAAVVTSPGEAITATTEHQPDVCVLDALFGGEATAAIQAAAQLRGIAPGTRVLILSASDSPAIVSAALDE